MDGMGLFLKAHQPVNAVRLVFISLIVSGFLFYTAVAQSDPDPGYPAYEDIEDAFDYAYAEKVSPTSPTFDVPTVNVTVVAGQDAVLPCSINRIGDYKVAWTNQEGKTYTYQQERVIDDSRVSILRPYTREWNLQIYKVKYSDQGQYRCTLNTDPVRSKTVQLYVKVPSKIIDELSSNDITVQEGETVVLICNVTGVPRPEVTWYRRKISSKSGKEKIGHIGEMIIIQNVSRYCDDEYECIAYNDVKPAVSRTMRVTVEFKPEITLRTSRIIQSRGRDTMLDCVITAYPHASIFWEKDGKRIQSSLKHRIENYDEGDHTITLSLLISEVDVNDFGQYKCVAENKIGRDEEIMHLDEPEGYEEEEKATEKKPVVGDIFPFTTSKPSNKPKKTTKSTPKIEKNHGQVGEIVGEQNGYGHHVLSVWLAVSCTLVTSYLAMSV